MNKLERIISIIDYVKKNSIYYRNILRDKEIKTLKDFETIEFLDKTLYENNTDYNNMHLICKDFSACYIFSSGWTTSSARYVARDFDDMYDQYNYFQWLDINGDDTVLNMFMPGIWWVFTTTNYALMKLWCKIIPLGSRDLDKLDIWNLTEILHKFNVNVLVGVPSTILRIWELISEYPELCKNINKMYYLWEKLHITAYENLLKLFPNVSIRSVYGCMETAAIWYQCKNIKMNFYHIFDYQYVEIIDLETWQVLEDGKIWEIVVTTLKKRMIPLIRYRTWDIWRVVNQKCLCGTSDKIIEVIGRKIDTLISASIHIKMDFVKELLYKIDRKNLTFQIEVSNKSWKDDIILLVESSLVGDERLRLKNLIMDLLCNNINDLKESIISKKINSFSVEIVDYNTIPRNHISGKNKLLLDKRR